MTKILVFILLLMLSGHVNYAQNQENIDSIEVIVNVEKAEFKKSLKFSSFLIAGGFVAITDNDLLSNEEYSEGRNEHFPDFQTTIDNYLQFAPIAVVYGLDLLGLKAKNDLANRTAILLKSELLIGGIIISTKSLTHKLRPDGRGYNSFPSGHTAQAFVAATFLHKEYGHLSPWISIGAYTMASAVGAMRILNNRHYVSDVLVGAGIGIFITNLVYYTHKHNWGKRMLILPIYNKKNAGLSVSLTF